MKNQFETFKPVKGYEGRYEISNFGRVKSLCKNIPYIMAPSLVRATPRAKSYLKIALVDNRGIRKTWKIHQLVAIHFIPHDDDSLCVNHKDGNTLNNDISNLEWVTVNYNNWHARHIIKTHYSKKIIAYKNDDDFARFDSIGQAARFLGICHNTIVRALNNGKKAKGLTFAVEGF